MSLTQEQGSLKFKSFNSDIIDIIFLNVGRKDPENEKAFLNSFPQGLIFSQVSSGVSQTFLAKE